MPAALGVAASVPEYVNGCCCDAAESQGALQGRQQVEVEVEVEEAAAHQL
jgi:hypothetical protein